MTEKEMKIKATENKAEDVVQPQAMKSKRIPIPPQAAVEVARLSNIFDKYIAGVVAGMGIKGPWQFDVQAKQVIIPDIGEKDAP